MRSSIYDTKHLFLTDLINASAYLKVYSTELSCEIISRGKKICKIKFSEREK